MPRRFRPRSALNRIKRAAFGVQEYAVMREACTFRFDAAEPLSNNRLEKEILYIINVHTSLTETRTTHTVRAPGILLTTALLSHMLSP